MRHRSERRVASDGERAADRSAALVVMTRVPEPGFTKTRMMPALSPGQCAVLHAAMLADAAALCRAVADRVDAFVAYAPPGSESAVRAAFDAPARFFPQRGEGLGARLCEAAREALEAGYGRFLIVGADSPELSPADVGRALSLLDEVDVVLGPASDGGFYLVGASEPPQSVFGLPAYGHSDVLAQAVEALRRDGASYALLRTIGDIDCWEDAQALLDRAKADASLERLRTVRYLREVAP